MFCRRIIKPSVPTSVLWQMDPIFTYVAIHSVFPVIIKINHILGCISKTFNCSKYSSPRLVCLILFLLPLAPSYKEEILHDEAREAQEWLHREPLHSPPLEAFKP